MPCRREHFLMIYWGKITPHCTLLLLRSDRWSHLSACSADHHSRHCWVTWQTEQSDGRSKVCDPRCERSSVWTDMFILVYSRHFRHHTMWHLVICDFFTCGMRAQTNTVLQSECTLSPSVTFSSPYGGKFHQFNILVKFSIRSQRRRYRGRVGGGEDNAFM